MRRGGANLSKLIFISLTLLLSLPSCNDSSTGNPSQQPGTVPSPTPSSSPTSTPTPTPTRRPTPAPTPTITITPAPTYTIPPEIPPEPVIHWLKIRLNDSGDMVTSSPDCQFPKSFSVWNDGHFRRTPCHHEMDISHENDEIISGSLTRSELRQLSLMVEEVAEGNLRTPPNCSPSGAISEVYLDLFLLSGSKYRVYEDSAHKGQCYLNGKEKVKALVLYFTSLMQKYYPQREHED